MKRKCFRVLRWTWNMCWCKVGSSPEWAWPWSGKLCGTSAVGGCKRRRGAERPQRPSQTSSRPPSPSAPDGSAATNTRRTWGFIWGMSDALEAEYAQRDPDLHWGRGGLTLIQAVEQIKSSHSDLEAERRQEEAAGRVQDQTTERSLLTLHGAAATQEIHC